MNPDGIRATVEQALGLIIVGTVLLLTWRRQLRRLRSDPAAVMQLVPGSVHS